MNPELLILHFNCKDANNRNHKTQCSWPTVYIFRKPNSEDCLVYVLFCDGHEIIRSSQSSNRSDACLLALKLIADRYGDDYILQANLDLWREKLTREHGDNYDIITVEFSDDHQKVIAHVRRRDTGEFRKWTLLYEEPDASGEAGGCHCQAEPPNTALPSRSKGPHGEAPRSQGQGAKP